MYSCIYYIALKIYTLQVTKILLYYLNLTLIENCFSLFGFTTLYFEIEHKSVLLTNMKIYIYF